MPPARHTLPLPRYATPVSPDKPPRPSHARELRSDGSRGLRTGGGRPPPEIVGDPRDDEDQADGRGHAESRADDEGEDEVAEVVDRAEGLSDAKEGDRLDPGREEVERAEGDDERRCRARRGGR